MKPSLRAILLICLLLPACGYRFSGGGSLPGETLDTWLLALDEDNVDKFLAKLRSNDPPIIARTENNRILLDPRTIQPEFDKDLLKGLKQAIVK